jgi:hypothetical protein
MIRKEFLYLLWYFLLCIPVVILYVNFSLRAKREWLALIGRIKQENVSEEQKREYIRLESAFPVEFQTIEGPTDREPQIYQGFTRDVSKAGICVETFTVRGKNLVNLSPNETRLRLIINIPSESETTIALGTVRWITKSEEMTVDRYSMGISFDEIAGPDLENIMKHVLWFRRKPDILGILVAIALMLMAAFFSTVIVLKGEKAELERKIRIVREDRTTLTKVTEDFKREKEELESRLSAVSQEREVLLARLRSLEGKRRVEMMTPTIPKESKVPLAEEERPIAVAAEEEPMATIEEGAELEEDLEGLEEPEIIEEFLEPIVELRRPARSDDEIVVEPNITRKMIKSERDVFNTLRDYILAEEMHLLHRYCSTHRTSIYHAAGLFALAELRYKNKSMKEMTMKAYRDVITLYPRSKYASYASHRMEQIKRNLPYESRGLKYYATNYNLPPLFSYRELEPYKK